METFRQRSSIKEPGGTNHGNAKAEGLGALLVTDCQEGGLGQHRLRAPAQKSDLLCAQSALEMLLVVGGISQLCKYWAHLSMK